MTTKWVKCEACGEEHGEKYEDRDGTPIPKGDRHVSVEVRFVSGYASPAPNGIYLDYWNYVHALDVLPDAVRVQITEQAQKGHPGCQAIMRELTLRHGEGEGPE